MDAILSLPLFFLPSGLVTYTTTSLNLLLFTLTWSSLLLTYPPLQLELVSSLLARILFFLIPSLISLAFDLLLSSLAVQIKRGGQKALPAGGGGGGGGGGGRRQSSRRRGAPPWWRVLLVVLGNMALDTLVQGGMELLLTKVLRGRNAVRVHKTLPLPGEIVWDILRSFALRETLQYLLHSLLLHPRTPTPLSRLHTTWSHNLPTPYSLTASYDHPLAHLLTTTLPTLIPLLLLNPHLLTTLLYFILTSLDDCLAYSGYTALPSVLLSGAQKRIDAHWASRGKGNYSKWGVCDWVGGTGVGGAGVEKDARREWERYDGGGKVEGAKRAGRELRRSARRKSGRSG